MSSTKTVLFIGATGGVTNACLVHTLRSSPPTTHCVALVRTPSKLRTLLESQHLTPEQLSPSRLTILPGNATDPAALRTALLYNPAHPASDSKTSSSSSSSDPANPLLPTAIITGLGGTPSLTLNMYAPLEFVKLDQPNICTDAARALVSSLRDILYPAASSDPSPPQRHDGTSSNSNSKTSSVNNQVKPHLIFVSTTGITSGPEDVPLTMRFLYHRILKEPHKDKRAMEAVFRAASESKHEQQEKEKEKDTGDHKVFASVTGIRPTLLTGETGALETGKGWKTVRVGTEPAPALGYTIARADVGEWMWEAVLRGWVEGAAKGRWEGEMCSLTS